MNASIMRGYIDCGNGASVSDAPRASFRRPRARAYRFNHNVDRKVKTEASRVRRVEIITGVERRRDWTDEVKLSIIAESCRDGVVISDVARRHGLRPQPLFTWRNEFRKRNAGGLFSLTPAAGGKRQYNQYLPFASLSPSDSSRPAA